MYLVLYNLNMFCVSFPMKTSIWKQNIRYIFSLQYMYYLTGTLCILPVWQPILVLYGAHINKMDQMTLAVRHLAASWTAWDRVRVQILKKSITKELHKLANSSVSQICESFISVFFCFILVSVFFCLLFAIRSFHS